jgi:hypothetical protein
LQGFWPPVANPDQRRFVLGLQMENAGGKAFTRPSNSPHTRLRRLLLSLAALLSAGATLSSPAAAVTTTKRVVFLGYELRVPAAWPVFDLARNPAQCVRFNRHAVYLGRPGADQVCPSVALGRTEAILVEPSTARARDGRSTLPSVSVPGAGPADGTMARTVDRAAGVSITATWNHDPGLIARALHLRSATEAAAASRVRPRPVAPATFNSQRTSARSSYAPGQVYTGKGFDVCSTPSSSRMSAWSSTYHAVGVYIGGTNMGCSQPNLTASWVSQESGAGWHLIPIYVGLQAPKNGCGCSGISPATAGNQGRAAAQDAVAQARSLGLGTGNPIYDDMEGYNRTGSNTSAVLAFLDAWTQQLHALGYKSGVYSSDDSGIRDLVSKYGGGFTEPDELWMANWNGKANTSDSNVPSHEWANHQRVHQYQSDTETHNGVRMNIDRDYLDAATAAPGGSVSGVPLNTAPPKISGSAAEGQTLIEEHGSWSGSPNAFHYQWEDCNDSGGKCSPISGATGQRYTLGSSDLGHTVRVQESATNSSGTGSPIASAHTAVVQGLTSTYWLFTAFGNVYTSSGAKWYGSPSTGPAHDHTIVGMSPSTDNRGYRLVSASGNVYNYGDAVRRGMHPALRRTTSIRGIVTAPTGDFWLFTRYGNVYTSNGAKWLGSPSANHAREQSIVGMTDTPDGKGYWLVDSSGRVFSYGDAPKRRMHPALRPTTAIIGIVPTPGGCYWLYTRYGNVYTSTGATFYGSPASHRAHEQSIVGMTVTADRKGYWLVDSSGRVFNYGDAPSRSVVPSLSHAHPIKGITR